jgi:hypothetical protein
LGAAFASFAYTAGVSLIDDRSGGRRLLRVLLVPGILVLVFVAVLVVQALN